MDICPTPTSDKSLLQTVVQGPFFLKGELSEFVYTQFYDNVNKLSYSVTAKKKDQRTTALVPFEITNPHYLLFIFSN